jgi:putative serine/threonine protein kinase
VKNPIIIPVDQLNKEPYSSVLCFPKPNEHEVQSRIQELCSLGVVALEFSGATSVFGVKVPVLGKGFVGIVVVAYVNGTRTAIKILRQDAGRPNLLHEASMLAKANAARVAPRFIRASKNFIVMQLVDGDLLPNWLKANKDPTTVKRVLRDALEQCWRLDEAGLDHGELSKAPKHLLVDKDEKVFIVDFETASAERRVSNVTAVCQYFFLGKSSAAAVISEVFGENNRTVMLDALKTYKNDRNRENFEILLGICFA